MLSNKNNQSLNNWPENPQEQDVFNTMYSYSTQSFTSSPSQQDTFLDMDQLKELNNLAHSPLVSPLLRQEYISNLWYDSYCNNPNHQLHYYSQNNKNLTIYMPEYPYPVFVFNLGYLGGITGQIPLHETKKMLDMAIPHLELTTLFNSQVVQTDQDYMSTVTYPTLYLDIPLPSSYTGHLYKHISPNPSQVPIFDTMRSCYNFQRSIPLTTDIERAFKLVQAVPYFYGPSKNTITTNVLRELYSIEPQSLYVYCMIYMCLFGYEFQPNGKNANALDLVIRQALFECSTIDAIVLMRSYISLLEFPKDVKGNWVKVSTREFNAVKLKILEYIDDKFTRMFYKLFNSPQSELLNYTGFLLITNLIRSSKLVVDDENQVLRALRQYLIINADVICAEKSRLAIPHDHVENIQKTPVSREIFNQRRGLGKQKIEIFQQKRGRIFFRISRYSQLVEDAICYMIAGIRWHLFGDNALSMLQYLYEDLNFSGIITELSFDTFCYLVESHRDPNTMLDRTIKQIGVGKGINKTLAQGVMTFKTSNGNGVQYPNNILLNYNTYDNRHYFQTFHLSSVGKVFRMNDLATFTRYHTIKMKESHVINRFLTFDVKIFHNFIRDIDCIPTNKFDRVLIKSHNFYPNSLIKSSSLRNQHDTVIEKVNNKYRNGYSHDCIMPMNFNELIVGLKQQVFAMQHPQQANRIHKAWLSGNNLQTKNSFKVKKSRRASVASSSSQDVPLLSMGNSMMSGYNAASSPMVDALNSSNNYTGRILASQLNSIDTRPTSNTFFDNNSNPRQQRQGMKRSNSIVFVNESVSGNPPSNQPSRKKKKTSENFISIEQQARENAELLSILDGNIMENIQPDPVISRAVPSHCMVTRRYVNFLIEKVGDVFKECAPQYNYIESVLDEITFPRHIVLPRNMSNAIYLQLLNMQEIIGVANIDDLENLMKTDETNVPIIDSMRINALPQRSLSDPTLVFTEVQQKDPEDINWDTFDVSSFCAMIFLQEYRKQQEFQEQHMQQHMLKQFDMMQNPTNNSFDMLETPQLNLILGPVGTSFEDMSFLDPMVSSMNELDESDIFK